MACHVSTVIVPNCVPLRFVVYANCALELDKNLMISDIHHLSMKKKGMETKEQLIHLVSRPLIDIILSDQTDLFCHE